MQKYKNNNKYNPIPYNVGLLDSLTIYLPLDKIVVLDERLTSEYHIIYPMTGLLIEDLNPPKPILINCNGVNFRFNKVVFPPNKINPNTTELIRLTLTSKMLFEHYFTGINKNNISDIIDYINSTNIINVNLETVLNSICNDIDICINYKLLFEPYKMSLQFLKDMVKPSKQRDVSIFPRKQTEKIDLNFGLMFGDRDKGSIGSPFCKYYNKTNELFTHSSEFYSKYLHQQTIEGLDINNIIRKEVTIKNSAFKAALIKKRIVSPNNELKTLNDILNLSELELTLICNIQLKQYFEKKIISISDDLTPTEKIITYYMFELIKNGADRITLFEPLNLISCKVQRSTTKKKIIRLIDLSLDTKYLQDKLQKNSIANEFIRLQQIF
jgi:hypothetical protein